MEEKEQVDQTFEEAMRGEGVQTIELKDRVASSTNTEPTLSQLASQANAVQARELNYLSDSLDNRFLVSPDKAFDWSEDGQQINVRYGIRLGRYKAGDQLDLHGKRIQQAHKEIWSFLKRSQDRGHQNVTIVHGKGERSNPPAQMKSYVGQVLIEHKDVKAYCSAPEEEGGLGATLIWIRKSDQAKRDNAERHQSRRG